MTNITAPLSESLSTYFTYKEIYGDDFENTSFTFLIPVYQEMPKGYTSHPIIGDTNNNLKDIKINSTSISGFDSDVVEYDYYINSDVKSLEISVTKESDTSIVEGEGTVNILDNEMEKEVVIKVTSETGAEKTYKITIIKIEEETPSEEEKLSVSDVLENVDVKINDTYISGIKENTTATQLNNSITKQYPNITVIITDKDGKDVAGILKTGDKVTIKTNMEEKTFVVVIKGDTNGDGKITTLDLLRIQKHILNYSKLNNENLESCDTNYDGNVNTLDLLRIQKHILNYIELK